jgi:signal transduction histidine kinase
MAFHYSSLMFFSSLVSFLIVLLYLCFILFTKNYKLNIVLFTIGRGLIAFGIIGIALRGNIPDLISLTVSNVFILTGTGVTILGILSYNKPKPRKEMVLILSLIIIISTIFYVLFLNSYSHRSFIIYLSMSLMVLIGSISLFLSRESFKFSVFISVVLFLFAAGRIVFAFQHHGLPDDFNPMNDDTISQLFVPFFSILSLAISVGFLFLLKEVDDRIIQNNVIELKRLNVNKDKLFKMIAHDLRTPFNSILGYSELLVDSSKKDSIEKIQKFASQINLAAKKAYDSTNDLLDWVLANTGNIKPNITEHLINDFINEITFEFSGKIAEKNIDLVKEIPENLSGSFDRSMVGSILRNLLNNAIKFSPENKRIIIKVMISNKQLEFVIVDQGIGIEKRKLENIFSTDPKISSPGTKGERGSGLGLSICKELIQNHSGEIWANSIVRKGSTFSFSIPQE